MRRIKKPFTFDNWSLFTSWLDTSWRSTSTVKPGFSGLKVWKVRKTSQQNIRVKTVMLSQRKAFRMGKLPSPCFPFFKAVVNSVGRREASSLAPAITFFQVPLLLNTGTFLDQTMLLPSLFNPCTWESGDQKQYRETRPTTSLEQPRTWNRFADLRHTYLRTCYTFDPICLGMSNEYPVKCFSSFLIVI